MENNKYIDVDFEIACGDNHTPFTDSVPIQIHIPSIDHIIDWSKPFSITWKESECDNPNEPIIKKYKCDHCVKSFNKARNRKRHVKINHNP